MAQVPSNLIPIRITGLPDAPVASENTLLVGVYNGQTYKIRAGDLLQVSGVPLTRQVIAGTGMTGGGALSSNVTLSIAPGGVGTAELASSGVTPGVYGDSTSVPQITIDATGRVMAATSIPLTISGYVPTTRQIIAGNGLLGGGGLNADVTLSANYGIFAPLIGYGTGVIGTSIRLAREDHQHPAVNLSSASEVWGVLSPANGGTGQSLIMNPGGIVYSSVDGLYVSSVGTSGQVLVSGGSAAPTWGSALVVAPVQAEYFFAGPVSGPNADPTFRAIANSDLPGNGALTINGSSVSLGGSVTVTAVNPNALTIGTGLGGTSYDGSAAVTITNTGVLSNIAGTGISVSGATGNVTITNTSPDQVVSIAAGSGISVSGTYPSFTVSNTGVLSWSGGTTGLTPATATTGAVTLGGTLSIANGGTNGSATPTAGAIAYGTATAYAFSLAGTSGYFLKSGGSGAPTWSNSIGGYIVDGLAPYLDWSNGVAVTLAAGRMWYNGSTGSWNLGMGGGNITQQVGEELFVYGKASSAITDSPLQIVYQTGTVGGSGVVTFGPTVAGITSGDLIIGVATENLASNAFGRITSFGVVHGITTNGTAYGEVWADGDTIWYNPITGNPTNVKPSAPNIKVSVGTVISAGSGGSGSFQVEVNHGSVLGGTDSNVQLNGVANANLLQYDSALQYWKNVAPSAVTGVGSLANALTIGTGLSGTSFNGSSAVTIAIDSTVATLAGVQTLTNKTISGASNTLSNIGNSSLTNSAITINGSSVSLGGSTTVTAVASYALTFGTHLTGTSYNGSAAVTLGTDATNLNTASTIVARDASGNFSAGTITAALSGNATSATNIAGGTAGALAYNTGSGATSFLALGTTNYVLTAGASAPQYVAQSTLSVGSASTATNLAGGAASQIPYQTGAGATSFIANGTAGQVLKSTGSTTPVWGGISGGTF